MTAPPRRHRRHRYRIALHRYRLTLMATLLVAILFACVASVPNVAVPAAASDRDVFAGVVAVDNTQNPDVGVYVLRDGTVVRRLGDVPGLTAVAFPLRTTDIVHGSTIAFAAHIIGSRTGFDYVSPAVAALEHRLYQWRLGSSNNGTDFRYRQASSDPTLRSRFGLHEVQAAAARAAPPATFVLNPVVITAPTSARYALTQRSSP